MKNRELQFFIFSNYFLQFLNVSLTICYISLVLGVERNKENYGEEIFALSDEILNK